MVFSVLPNDLLLGTAEGIPGVDALMLRLKRLSLGPQWVPGDVVHARMLLNESSFDAALCKMIAAHAGHGSS
jgi:hypothetical protein